MKRILCLWGIILVTTGMVNLKSIDATDVYLDIRSSEVRKVALALPYFEIPLNQPELIPYRNDALKILTFDLRESGLFQLLDVAAYSNEINSLYRTQKTLPYTSWYLKGAQAIVVGAIKKSGSEFTINGSLFDVKLEMMMTGKKYSGDRSLFRAMMHRFADEIIFRFTGEHGIAHSKIAYVQGQGAAKEIIIIDYDGFNEERLTTNNSINLSPEWSSDRKSLYFTSFFEAISAVYCLTLKDRKVVKIASFSGMNSAPAISPDNTKLALTLSKDGNSEIYVMSIASRKLNRLTFHRGIDTSPSWSPTGREIVFTSDRVGTPQLYVMDAEGTNLRRLTYHGNYNDSADWSPQGNLIAFASRKGGIFNIFTVSVEGGNLKQLTSKAGKNENPSWSPDGNFIVFSSTRDGTANIFIMDKFGHNQRRLTFQSGNCTAPDWSP
ncbi:Tol-Pal system beta propeller repeat protein TolB [candidate division CSSED10-310 bacterium]|uniref:Tol-Pal system beta propeller repeat protein TolB n=1 Tax=candidate division CSSED10-310 bacterium TaxID=2855610 RepID=A0ABV6YV46_UNCC1